MKKIILLSIYGLGLFLFSCKKDKSLPPLEPISCDSITVSFSADIQPIFVFNCAFSGCHDAATANAGYVWENYGQISANADQAIRAMKHVNGFTPMPYLSPKLHDSLINKVQCWIEDGTPNN